MFGKTIKATVATAAACALATALAPATANAQRGSAGHLNILYWQAASTVNPYLSGGTKDIEAGSMVLDPLVHYDENGNMVPVLVEEIPTVENGGVASDLRSITYRIRKDVQWSDGTPLTAHDVVFSGEYCLHPGRGLQRRLLLHGRDRVRGARRPHREDQLRGREAPSPTDPSSDRPRRSSRRPSSRTAWEPGPRSAPSRTSAPSAPAPSRSMSSAPTT